MAERHRLGQTARAEGGDGMRKRVGRRGRADAPDSPANPFTPSQYRVDKDGDIRRPLISKDWTQMKER